MQVDIIIFLSFWLGIFFLLIGGISYLYFNKKKPIITRQRIALKTISAIWSNRKDVVVSLEELATLWRTTVAVEKEKEKQILFNSIHITRFIEKYLEHKTFYTGIYRSSVNQILKLLEQEGSTPSVVNIKGEVYQTLDSETYTILSNISLLEHSINVAEQSILLNKDSLILPKLILCSLAHDLGKIPSYRNKYYSLGDHPIISVMILENIEPFNLLQYKDAVLKAIKEHHKSPKDPLALKLKEADQSARAKEIKEYLTYKEQQITKQQNDQILQNTPNSVQQNDQTTKQQNTLTLKVADNNINSQINIDNELNRISVLELEKQKQESEERKQEKENIKLELLQLHWLSSIEIINQIKPMINKMKGGRWEVFSMPNGYVYVHINYFWEIIKKLAKICGHQEILLGDTDKDYKRNIIYSAVYTLREDGHLADDIIQRGYFAAPFVITMRDGRQHAAFFIPLKTESFTNFVSDLEVIKEGKIKEIVNVGIKNDKEDE